MDTSDNGYDGPGSDDLGPEPENGHRVLADLCGHLAEFIRLPLDGEARLVGAAEVAGAVRGAVDRDGPAARVDEPRESDEPGAAS